MRRARRAIIALGVAFVLLDVLPTIQPIRTRLAAPLVVNDADARGDAAYVMLGGTAIDERLRASADLIHLSRVRRLLLVRDNAPSQYSFVERRSLTRTDWMLKYLAWLGVPADRVTVLDDPAPAWLGSLHEATIVSAALPDDVHRLVIVTSPMHTRRALLAFRRRLGARPVALVGYAATEPSRSVEFFSPLWLEYVKLATYALVA